jgi:hypothetical protein
MKKIFLVIMMVVGMGVVFPFARAEAVVVGGGTPDPARCERSFLGFQPWYRGLTVVTSGDKCVVGTPNDDGLPMFVWTIVLNILGDLFVLVGYLSVGFLIYGGYTYALARGLPEKIAKGKKIIVSAIAGLVIAVVATFAANTIVNIITEATGAGGGP